MKRELGYLGVAVLAMFSVAAKGSGCSGELTDDGTSDAWPTATPPVAGPAQPMTCAFLKEDNCWKRFVAKVVTCAGDLPTTGRLDEARKVCTGASGARLELGGAVNTPAPGNTAIVGTDWRILAVGGATCATGKITGVGRSLLDAQGEVVTFESTSLLGYRVTCPDGSTFTNEGPPAPDAGAEAADGAPPAEGAPAAATDDAASVCPSFGLDYLAKKTPGVLLSCEGTPRACKLALWGGATGETVLSTCGW